jgi:DNA polymerase-3 subunit delta'
VCGHHHTGASHLLQERKREDRVRAIVGHEQAVGLLGRAVASGLVAHAYLFVGPDGIGKTVLAMEFARLLQCEQPDLAAGDPCGVCSACRRIAHGNHPDVTLVEAEEGKRQLGIDAVRDNVIHLANLAPSSGRWRVFILPNVERMTPNTVNALLKTLEEPPERVVLLLTTAEPENLLPTLVSRCQIVPMRPLDAHVIAEALIARWSVPDEQARILAGLASGRLGWAVRAHDDPDLASARAEQLNKLIACTYAGRDERLVAAARFGADADAARSAIEIWMLWWRDVVLAAHGATHLLSDGGARDEAAAQGRALGPERVERFLRALIEAQSALDQNANPRLTLDVLMLDLPHLSRQASARR